MATTSTTTQRRKGGGGGPPKSLEGLVEMSEHLNLPNINGLTSNTALLNNSSGDLTIGHGTASPTLLTSSSTTNATTPIIATVRRNKFGTSPFDENWLNVDCCGLFCAGVTYLLHCYGVYAVCIILIPPWMSTTDAVTGLRSLSFMGHFHRLAFTFVAVMAVYAHAKAMTTDPGAVPPDAMPLEELRKQQQQLEQSNGGDLVEGGEAPKSPQQQRKGKRLCRRCNSFKPKRAHHCSVCQRCIIKMDHHCPWVNNCVGIGNHKYFLLFVFYTFVSCMYSFSLVLTRFWGCMHRQHGRHTTCLDRPTQLLSILGLIVEAILFGMFTACMMLDQVGVVTSKMTHIDRLKHGGGGFEEDQRPLMMGDGMGNPTLAGVVEVFGLSKHIGVSSGYGATRFRPDWLSPFAKACFPASIQDDIMGFCRPCTRNNHNIHPMNSSSNSKLDGGGEMELGTSSHSQMIRSVTEIV